MRTLLRGLGRFVLGASIGAAAAAAATYFAAPSSGEEFKRRLRNRLAEAKAAGEQAEQETVATLERRFKRQVDQYTRAE